MDNTIRAHYRFGVLQGMVLFQNIGLYCAEDIFNAWTKTFYNQKCSEYIIENHLFNSDISLALQGFNQFIIKKFNEYRSNNNKLTLEDVQLLRTQAQSILVSPSLENNKQELLDFLERFHNSLSKDYKYNDSEWNTIFPTVITILWLIEDRLWDFKDMFHTLQEQFPFLDLKWNVHIFAFNFIGKLENWDMKNKGEIVGKSVAKFLNKRKDYRPNSVHRIFRRWFYRLTKNIQWQKRMIREDDYLQPFFTTNLYLEQKSAIIPIENIQLYFKDFLFPQVGEIIFPNREKFIYILMDRDEEDGVYYYFSDEIHSILEKGKVKIASVQCNGFYLQLEGIKGLWAVSLFNNGNNRFPGYRMNFYENIAYLPFNNFTEAIKNCEHKDWTLSLDATHIEQIYLMFSYDCLNQISFSLWGFSSHHKNIYNLKDFRFKPIHSDNIRKRTNEVALSKAHQMK